MLSLWERLSQKCFLWNVKIATGFGRMYLHVYAALRSYSHWPLPIYPISSTQLSKFHACSTDYSISFILVSLKGPYSIWISTFFISQRVTHKKHCIILKFDLTIIICDSTFLLIKSLILSPKNEWWLSCNLLERDGLKSSLLPFEGNR